MSRPVPSTHTFSRVTRSSRIVTRACEGASSLKGSPAVHEVSQRLTARPARLQRPGHTPPLATPSPRAHHQSRPRNQGSPGHRNQCRLAPCVIKRPCRKPAAISAYAWSCACRYACLCWRGRSRADLLRRPRPIPSAAANGMGALTVEVRPWTSENNVKYGHTQEGAENGRDD